MQWSFLLCQNCLCTHFLKYQDHGISPNITMLQTYLLRLVRYFTLISTTEFIPKIIDYNYNFYCLSFWWTITFFVLDSISFLGTSKSYIPSVSDFPTPNFPSLHNILILFFLKLFIYYSSYIVLSDNMILSCKETVIYFFSQKTCYI